MLMLVIAAWTSRMFAAVFWEHLVDGDEMDAPVGFRTLGLFALKNWSNAPEVRKTYVVLHDFVH